MMFRNLEQNESIKTQKKLLREANAGIMSDLDNYFREHNSEMRKQLNDENIVGEAQEKFIKNLYHQSQVEMIKTFKENLRRIALEEHAKRQAEPVQNKM